MSHLADSAPSFTRHRFKSRRYPSNTYLSITSKYLFCKMGNIGSAVAHVSHICENLKRQTESLRDGQLGDLLDTATRAIDVAQAVAQSVAVAGIALRATTTLSGLEAQRHIEKLMGEMSESLKRLSRTADVSVNLQHQATFHEHVYRFAAYQIKLATPQQPDGTPQFFFIYHPSNEWHDSFDERLSAHPLIGLVGATDSLGVLGQYLLAFRNEFGRDAVLHVLVPSAHLYVLPDEICVPQELRPLRITGQTNFEGIEYCQATLLGLEMADVRSVKIMPPRLSRGGNAVAKSASICAAVGAGATAFGGVLVPSMLALNLLCPPVGLALTAGVWTSVVTAGLVGGAASKTAANAVEGYVTNTLRAKKEARVLRGAIN